MQRAETLRILASQAPCPAAGPALAVCTAAARPSGGASPKKQRRPKPPQIERRRPRPRANAERPLRARARKLCAGLDLAAHAACDGAVPRPGGPPHPCAQPLFSPALSPESAANARKKHGPKPLAGKRPKVWPRERAHPRGQPCDACRPLSDAHRVTVSAVEINMPLRGRRPEPPAGRTVCRAIWGQGPHVDGAERRGAPARPRRRCENMGDHGRRPLPLVAAASASTFARAAPLSMLSPARATPVLRSVARSAITNATAAFSRTASR